MGLGVGVGGEYGQGLGALGLSACISWQRPSHPARVLAKQIQALGRVSQELTKDQPNRKVAVEWRRPEDFIGWASAGAEEKDQ